MKIDVFNELRAYCQELAGSPVALLPDEGVKNRLPMFLGQAYEPYRAELFGEDWTMLLPKRPGNLPAGEIAGHARLVAPITNGVFVFPNLATYERNRLLQRGIPFIVPHRQVFLPGRMVSLKERQGEVRPKDRKTLSAPAQAIVLFHLQKGKETLLLSEWARLLGYSRMTATRAGQEIVDLGLAERKEQGRTVRLEFGMDQRRLWGQVEPLMTNPVSRRVHVRLRGGRPNGAVEAGLSALARYSDLAAGRQLVLAMTPAKFKATEETPTFADTDTTIIEQWRYDPAVLSEDGMAVDRLSLYLSLRGSNDERVEAALTQMLEGVIWWRA